MFGYLPGSDYRGHSARERPRGVSGGDHASALVARAIDNVSTGGAGSTDPSDDGSKLIRSYGSVSRGSDGAASQDPHTGAVTELLCKTALPIHENGGLSGEGRAKLDRWVASVNGELETMLDGMTERKGSAGGDWSPGRLRVFGRVSNVNIKFCAESDMNRRRVDYCLPADLLFTREKNISTSAVQPGSGSLQDFCDSLNDFEPGTNTAVGEVHDLVRPDASTLAYMLRLKQLMMKFSSQVEDLDETVS